MNHESDNPLTPVGDDALEARIVAWILGEASSFEAAELEKLCAADPALRLFEQRMRELHQLMGVDAKAGPDAEWKISAERRAKITDLLGVDVVELVPRAKTNRYFARRVLLAAAACLMISLIAYSTFGTAGKSPGAKFAESRVVDFMPASASGGESGVQLKRRSLDELRRSVQQQEDAVEDKRKLLSQIIRQEGIIYQGDPSVSQGADFSAVEDTENAAKSFFQLERDKIQLESQLETLAKSDGEQLMNYAGGLSLPDNVIPQLLPQYQEQKREVETLKSSGLGADHPTVVAEAKKLALMEEDLTEATANLRETLKAKLELTKEQTARLESRAGEKNNAAIKSSIANQTFVDARGDFEASQRMLEVLKAKLASEEAQLAGGPEPAADTALALNEQRFGSERSKRGVPQKKPASAYTPLWSDSAFTVKPPPAALAPETPLPEIAEAEGGARGRAFGRAGGGGAGDAQAEAKTKLAEQLPESAASAGGIDTATGTWAGRDTLATLGDSVDQPAGPAAGQAGVNVTDIVTGGNRSGDAAINRNNIDAILNNPNQPAEPQGVAGSMRGTATREYGSQAGGMGGAAQSDFGNTAIDSFRADLSKSLADAEAAQTTPQAPAEAPADRFDAVVGAKEAAGPAPAAKPASRPAALGKDVALEGRTQMEADDALSTRKRMPADASGFGLATDGVGERLADGSTDAKASASDANRLSYFFETPPAGEPKPQQAQNLPGQATASSDAAPAPASPAVLGMDIAPTGSPEPEVRSKWDSANPANPALAAQEPENVDKVRRSLYTAEGHYNLGKFDEAQKSYEDAIRIDPHNEAARRGKERVAQAKTDYYRAAYDHTRAELLAQVDKDWELSVPPLEEGEKQVAEDGEKAGEGEPSGRGYSGVAQKEMLGRQNAVAQSDQLRDEGREAYAKGDFKQAVDKFKESIQALPDAPMVKDRKDYATQLLSDGTAALGEQYLKAGEMAKARELADGILVIDPNNAGAKALLLQDEPQKSDETSATAQPFSTFSLHVSDASFKLAKAALERGEQPDPASIRPEEFYNAFDYGDPAPGRGEPVACTLEQSAHPAIPQRNLVRIAVRAGSTGRGQSTPLNLTLLLDSSGSMEREDRHLGMKMAVQQLAGLLKEGDTVSVIGFSRQPRLLVDRLSGARAQELNALIAQTPSEGGTNLEEGLKLAEELAKRQFNQAAQNRIVLFTDGAANLGDAQPETLQTRVEEMRQGGIAFDAAGFGADGLNDKLLERLTRNGNGRYYIVDRPEDADANFAKQLAGAFRPAAENVKVQVRFNPSRVGKYKLMGFEEHRLKKEDFRNDAVDAAEMAAEEAGNALYQVETLPGGEGEIGEVSVRFRDAASGQMVERTWTIPYEAQAPAFDQATPSIQLAGLSAMAAEKLRNAPMADAIDFQKLSPILGKVKARYPNSQPVSDLGTILGKLR